MAWFDRNRSGSERPQPVTFRDVTPNGRRNPSWLAPPSGGGQRRVHSSLPPRPSRETPAPRTTAERRSSHVPAEPVKSSGTRRPSSTATRPSMTPSDFEALIAERVAQQAEVRFLDQSSDALGAAIEALDKARRETLYGSEVRIVDLVLLIARRVIARELTTQPELVADLVREGLDALDERDQLRVYLGEGFAVVATMVSGQLSARGIDVEIHIDASLPLHGCVVETDIGRVDESIEARLQELSHAIEAEIEEP